MISKINKSKTTKKLLTKPVKVSKSKAPKQPTSKSSSFGRKGALGATSGY